MQRPATLAITGLTLAPKPPRPGRALSALLSLRTENIARPTSAIRLACAADVGQAELRATRVALALQKGSKKITGTRLRATCIWQVPRQTSGQSLKGTVAIVYGAVTLRRTFEAKVR